VLDRLLLDFQGNFLTFKNTSRRCHGKDDLLFRSLTRNGAIL
jgi:hypothetical protein